MSTRRSPAPVIMPKGQRYPGSGRVKGTPNKVSVEAKQLVGELVNDAAYQARLRRDFALRRVHPTIESMLWAYHIGKPRQDVTLTASIDVNARLEEDKRIFASLEVADLEALAVESQGFMDRAKALAQMRVKALTPPDIVVEPEVPKVSEEMLGKEPGSDNAHSVTHSTLEDSVTGNPTDTDG